MGWQHTNQINIADLVGLGTSLDLERKPRPLIDSFGRLRVSNPTSLFDTQLQYNDQPLFWETQLTAGGTTTHIPNSSALDLEVTTASGDKVVRQTRKYFRYQPGKSQLITLTGVFNSSKNNLRQQLGYMDADNGVFFQYDDTTFSIVLRSKTSGSVIEEVINQVDWNIDSFDGSGESGINLNFERGHVYVIDLEWLSIGTVRTGFFIDGTLFYAHDFDHSNDLSTAYMTTANLPIRYEIENTGAVVTSSKLREICTSVISEGGFQNELGIPMQTGNSSLISVTTERPILSIRPKSTFNSIAFRGNIDAVTMAMFSEDQDAYYRIYYGGTLTDASFNDVNATYSAVEFDVAATAIADGIVIAGGFASAGGKGTNQRGGENVLTLLSKLALTIDIDGNHPTSPFTDSLTMTAESIGGVATDVLGQFTWTEQR